MIKDKQGYILCFKIGKDETKPDHLQEVKRTEKYLAPGFVANKTMFTELGWKVVEDEKPELAPSLSDIGKEIKEYLSEITEEDLTDKAVSGISKLLNTKDIQDDIQKRLSNMPEQNSDVKINLPETFDINEPVNKEDVIFTSETFYHEPIKINEPVNDGRKRSVIMKYELQPEQTNTVNEKTKVKRPRIKKPKKRAYNRKPKTETVNAD